MSLELDSIFSKFILKTDRPSNNRVYEFGEFRLDAGHLMLYRSDEELSLAPRAVETLLALVERRGEIVSKDELMQAIWSDSVVEESNLAQYLSVLRKTLGDQGSGRPYIETFRRRGYRFNADVTVSDREPNRHSVPAAHSPRPLQVQRRGNVLALAEWERAESSPAVEVHHAEVAAVTADRVVRRSLSIAVAVALIAAVSIAAYLLWPNPRPAGGTIESLAILPFKPLDRNAGEEPFQLGLADALISRFGGSSQLTVRPLRAVRGYMDLDGDAADIGRRLGADAVLDGNYQRDGDRLRLTLRLVQSADGKLLWSDKFDLASADSFALQDAISARLSAALIPRLADSGRFVAANRGTTDAKAFELYQRGRYFWNQRTNDGFRRAIKAFEEAVAIDPNFAQAYSGLADAEMFLAATDRPMSEAVAKGRAYARRALELNDRLAEPHASLGLIAINHDWDFAAGERHLRRAIEIDPGYATAHHWLGDVCLTQSGRFDEGAAELERARQLDPLSPIINTDIGKHLVLAGRYDDAIAQLHRALELDPSFGTAYIWLSLAHAEKGEFEKADEVIKRAGYGNSFINSTLHLLLDAYAGRPTARTGLAALLRDTDEGTLARHPGAVAMIYARLGERDKAFEWLEKEFEARGIDIVGLKTIPVWRPLHGAPRFDAMLKRAGF